MPTAQEWVRKSLRLQRNLLRAATFRCVQCNLARAHCRMRVARAAYQPTIVVVLSFLRLEEVGDGLADLFIVRLICYLQDTALSSLRAQRHYQLAP